MTKRLITPVFILAALVSVPFAAFSADSADEKPSVPVLSSPAAKPEEAKPTVRMSPIITPTPKPVQKAAQKPAPKKPEPAKTAVNETKPAEKPADSPFKKAQPPEEEKILDIKPVEDTKPRKLASPDEEEAERLARETEASGKFERSPAQKKGESGLNLPRFVSLKSGEVNGRAGPGETYPIKWVYQRKNLPVEVTAEFKQWRRIRDIDGDQTWVHQALLRGERYAILEKDGEATRDKSGNTKVAQFKRNVQVKLTECSKMQCLVEYGSIRGWTAKSNLFGVYNDETFD